MSNYYAPDQRLEVVNLMHDSRWWGHHLLWKKHVEQLGYCTDCSVRLQEIEHAVRKLHTVDADTGRGLYQKYHVDRLRDPDGKHDKCPFFVLDPVHDIHARDALITYIESCRGNYPELAESLRHVLDETQWEFKQYYRSKSA